MTFQIGRLAWAPTEPFGAEVDFDFSLTLTAEEAAGFRSLLFERSLLVMRDQRLSLEQQQALAGHIGPVLSGGRGIEYVSPDDGVLGETAMTYHSDLAFAPEPFTALSLHALDVAPKRTSTRFVSAARAYRMLPDELKRRLVGLKALSISVALDGERRTPFETPPGGISAVRDVVWSHPVTSEPILYVSESHAGRIEGLSRADSDALLQTLFGYIYAPDNRIEHAWTNGDLVVWDNIALQHGRPEVAGVGPRRLQRAAVAERGLLEQLPNFMQASA